MEREQPSGEEDAQRETPKVEPEADDLPKQEPGSGPAPEKNEG